MDQISNTLDEATLHRMHSYWRAANYLSVGQIYLRDNPLLKQPLERKHIKHTLLGHWGTTPGQNFIYVHLNRAIMAHQLNMIYISGPGHGGPALTSNTYLEGSFTAVYPEVTQDEHGMGKLFKMFSFPGGLSSHVSPQVPGSIHEGGELGYSLAHAYGAVLDNPSLVVACVVGDGEAETGALATSWHSNKFINPITDGAVLPILHLNGFKISNPTVLARIEPSELDQMFRGMGYEPIFVEGDDPIEMHRRMADAVEHSVLRIKEIQQNARSNQDPSRPRWPMIVLRTPKGWTGPKEVDGHKVEGSFRSHQVPITIDESNPDQSIAAVESWMRSYRPEELFTESGDLLPELKQLIPEPHLRMGMNKNANGGVLFRELHMPDFRNYALDVPSPGSVEAGDTSILAPFLRDIIKLNEDSRNFRIFGPDELVSNRLSAVFETTNRQWQARTNSDDEGLAPEGAVMDSMLSEHMCQGWLEGYLLTGRHGLFHSYEAFIRIVDSMASQHAKWLKMSGELPWREPIASLNYLLTSHVWRQDHNGFTHQDPGFIDHLLNKKPENSRIYLPPDANCLLSVVDHCLRSRDYINMAVCGKHPAPQWLNMDQAIDHCTKGIDIWNWASNEDSNGPDVVMAAAGDVPTKEVLAAITIIRQNMPNIKIRMINVVDLMKMQPDTEHPHGLSDYEYDELFTTDRPIIFAFHGYPWLIHRLAYRRRNQRLHVRGYVAEGTITTAFDMTVLNRLDRYHLVLDVIERAGLDGPEAESLKVMMEQKLIEHRNYINDHGVDMPEILNWKWQSQS